MLLKLRNKNPPGLSDTDGPATWPQTGLDGTEPDGALSCYGAPDGSMDWLAIPVVEMLPQVSNGPFLGPNGALADTNGSDAGAAPGAFSARAELTGSPLLGERGANSSIGGGGATGAQVQQALGESGLSVTGAGIKVGVFSDSFNDLGGAAADEADGALPPASSIQVIEDLASGGSDEGRAMMQIVHDIAPGASLAFYTAFNSEQDFANGILALAAAGCKVICDDVSYFDEPFFQNGIVAQAIQTVEAQGVVYVTSAGNDGSNAYQAAWTPVSGTFDGIALQDTESFSGSLVQTVTVGYNRNYDVPLLLEWNQPYGAATSDLELLVFRNGALFGEATNSSVGEPTNPWTGIDLPGGATYQIAIENLSGPNPGLIKEIAAGDGIPVTISGANVGTVYGHAMTPGVITAGAVSTAETPAFGVSPPQSESFSSSGAGTELLFDNNGNPLSSPDPLSPVVVSGVDNISTTVPGGLSDFYGTSAASASMAGVAALILAANPTLTPAQVEQIVAQTAIAMGNPTVSGAGLAQIDAAVLAATGAAITVTATSVEAVQGGAAVALLASAPTITDSASSTLAGATIRVANDSGNPVAGDRLFAAGQQSGTLAGGAVSVSWNASSSVLTLSGTASIATYQVLLGEITYRDTGNDSSTGGHPQRTVTWTVNDSSTSASTTSQLTIDRNPVANNDTGADLAGATSTVNAAAGVLATDSDPDGDALAVTGVSDSAHGSGTVGQQLAGVYGHLTLNADGSYSYRADLASAISGAPTGSHPHDIFTYTIGDGNGGSASAMLDITVDRMPVAVNAAGTDAAGATLTVDAAAGVLADDSDPDGDPLTVSAVNGVAGNVGVSIAGAYGHLTLAADGSYAYSADALTAIANAPAGSHPQDGFSYTVSDGHGGTASATLSITLNRAPTLSGAPAVLTYTIGQSSALALASSIAINNLDGTTLSGATISVSAGKFSGDGDALAATTTGTAIIATYDVATEILALRGVDTLAHYRQVLDSVTYSTSSGDPTNSGLAATRTVVWVINNGDTSNNLSQPQITTISFGSPPPSHLVPDDFTSPTTSDILFYNSATGDTAYWQISNGSVFQWVDLGIGGTSYSPVGTGDFLGNGISDVLWFSSAMHDTGFWSIANGTVSGWHDLGTAGSGYAVAGVGDFYGGGTSDVLWFDSMTRDAGFWSIGNGAVSGWQDFGTAGSGYTVAGFGDFYNSGTSDVLWFNSTTRDAGFWAITNGTVAGWQDLGTAGSGYTVAGVGDFFGNGATDVLWFNSTTGDTGFWSMGINGVVTGWHDLGTAGSGYNLVAIGDYLAGNTSDVLFANPAGDIGFWAIANGTVTGWHDLGTAGAGYSVHT